jgi:predicted GNAT superfamily acetyltransferase
MDAVSGLFLRAVEEMAELRPVVALFTDVWGRNEDGVPIPAELLRSLAHAGGLVTAAYDEDTGELLGAGALGRAEPEECYGYIAAARPGYADRGIGFAVKQHQRAWALQHGLARMSWTFDPLVSRNARFNLTKLGARAFTYLPRFYGEMSDLQNGTDVGDRLVARWDLDSPRADLAARGIPMGERDPDPQARPAATAPDGAPGLLASATDRWIRVPRDIVSLRTDDRDRAAQWRESTRALFLDSLDHGWVADAVSRTGWYHLTPPATDPTKGTP